MLALQGSQSLWGEQLSFHDLSTEQCQQYLGCVPKLPCDWLVEAWKQFFWRKKVINFDWVDTHKTQFNP